MGPHFLLPFPPVVPLPLQESAAVAHVRLLRFPGVPPQLQLRFDPVQDVDLFVGQVWMSPITSHVRFLQGTGWPCRRESRASPTRKSEIVLSVETARSYAGYPESGN